MAISEEELALMVDEAEWGWLRAHLERGGIIIVSADEDLAATGFKIARDDSHAVQALIEGGKLTKPTGEEIAAWDNNREKRFKTLIVSPYVLIQEALSTKEVLQ